MSAREITASLLVADGTVADLERPASYQTDMGPCSVREYLYAKTPEEIFEPLRRRRLRHDQRAGQLR